MTTQQTTPLQRMILDEIEHGHVSMQQIADAAGISRDDVAAKLRRPTLIGTIEAMFRGLDAELRIARWRWHYANMRGTLPLSLDAISSVLAMTGRTRYWLAKQIGIEPKSIYRVMRGRCLHTTVERMLAALDARLVTRNLCLSLRLRDKQVVGELKHGRRKQKC